MGSTGFMKNQYEIKIYVFVKSTVMKSLFSSLNTKEKQTTNDVRLRDLNQIKTLMHQCKTLLQINLETILFKAI